MPVAITLAVIFVGLQLFVVNSARLPLSLQQNDKSVDV